MTLSLDREIDLVSPLVTPLTYEGLVDDIIGIRNGAVSISSELLGDDKEAEALAAKMGAAVHSASSSGKSCTWN